MDQIPAAWLERYGQRVENYRLPKADQERRALAEQRGADGLQLLHALAPAGVPDGRRELPGIQVLRQVWQHYSELSWGRARWRGGPEVGAKGGGIRAPYDPEARRSQKRERIWLGYKVHLTETCASDAPHLLVDVQRTTACGPDVEMTAVIQAELAERGVAPASSWLIAATLLPSDW